MHHVYAKGSDGQRIVLDTIDRLNWIRMLAAAVEKYRWKLFAWCLMTNHFHLLLQVGALGLSRGMQRLNGGYSRAFNSRHGHGAHLFRNRFGSRLIESDEDLLTVCRYIERNVVEAGICTSPDESRWSSFRAVAGLDPAPAYLARDELLALFGLPDATAVERYRIFVLAPA